MTMIGVEKTLIIACGEYAMQDYSGMSEDVVVYCLAGQMLQRYDSRERDQLRAVIDACKCTQLIFLGALDEGMYARLDRNSALYPLRKGLCFDTHLLPKGAQTIPLKNRYRALLEQHVASQCAELMEYHFIRHNVQKGLMNVRGVVGTPYGEDHKTVFLNGVRCNDLISMN